MSPAERQARSALARLVRQPGLLRGNLLERRRVCGKRNCRCVRGELRAGLYLVFSEGGQLRQLSVPKTWEDRVRQWVADYHEARRCLEQISRLHVARQIRSALYADRHATSPRAPSWPACHAPDSVTACPPTRRLSVPASRALPPTEDGTAKLLGAHCNHEPLTPLTRATGLRNRW